MEEKVKLFSDVKYNRDPLAHAIYSADENCHLDHGYLSRKLDGPAYCLHDLEYGLLLGDSVDCFGNIDGSETFRSRMFEMSTGMGKFLKQAPVKRHRDRNGGPSIG